MSDQPTPRLNKVPFLLGDALLLGVAGYFVLGHGPGALGWLEMLLVAGTVAGGAVLAIVPFLVEYKALSRLAESDLLGNTVRQLQNVEGVARNVTAATAQWQGIQSLAAQTNKTAKEIADRMSEEVAGFTEFLKKTNDAEKATLRLEVEKLRRVEGDWLQVVVGMLDHVAALHRAAIQAGQPQVLQQVTAFQHACRDIARRVGVTFVEARPGEEFDDSRHRLPQAEAEVPDAAVVEQVLMPGVAFQGRLLRPVIVTVATPAPAVESVPTPEPVSETAGEPTVESAGPAAVTPDSETSPTPAEATAEAPAAARGDQPALL
jgi:molecular chaperone GrpE (heat shock protein)